MPVDWLSGLPYRRDEVHPIPKPVEQIKVTFRLPVSLVRRAKHYAVDHDMDLQEVMAQALEAFLKGGRA